MPCCNELRAGKGPSALRNFYSCHDGGGCSPQKKNSPRNYQEPTWERVLEDTMAWRISTWDHLGLTPWASGIATDSFTKRKGVGTDGAIRDQSGDQVWGSTPVNKGSKDYEQRSEFGSKTWMSYPGEVNFYLFFIFFLTSALKVLWENTFLSHYIT